MKFRQITIFLFIFIKMTTIGCLSYGRIGVIDTDYSTETRLAPESELTLITWNVAKNIENNVEIERLIADYSPDVLMIQEGLSRSCDIFGPSFQQCLFAPSWKRTDPDIYTGVQTLSRFRLENPIHVESPGREGFLFTPKTSLVSFMDLPDGRSLMLVNVHMLNFVPTRELKKNLDVVHECVRDHDGPLIIGGDFNTWSNARLNAVREFAQRLDMVEALALNELDDAPFSWFFLLKPFLHNRLDASLDRWFCRGVEVVACRKLGGFYSSDHVPVLLQVRALSH